MFFQITNLTVDGEDTQGYITDNPNPVFSWAAEHSEDGKYQSAYHVTVKSQDKVKWDTGWVTGKKQSARYKGEPLLTGENLTLKVQIRDNDGKESSIAEGSFTAALMEDWKAAWITTPWENPREAKYFIRKFSVDGPVKNASLYVCGIGYQDVKMNGEAADDAFLQPAISNYGKQCYYVTLPVERFLKQGDNFLEVTVGDGWRGNTGEYLDGFKDREFEIFGPPMLTAELRIIYEDQRMEQVFTDTSWLCGHGPVVFNHLFDGEIYDERIRTQYTQNAVLVERAAPKMKASAMPPIRARERLTPVMKTKVGDGYVFDFGTNIAGIVEVVIPQDMPAGTRIRIHHGENILPEGGLDKETLRRAKAIDEFICGGKKQVRKWYPKFVYHGFRYIYVEGWHTIPKAENFTAVALYTDVKNRSYFRCGSPIVNQIQEIIVRTEKNNLHSIATDCPQRDERMGWMNDATVRFEETPYNFRVNRLFHKIVEDIAAEQSEDGAITCTAPFIYGERPADPVCSSFLVAAWENYLHYGDRETMRKHYPHFKAWNRCLKEHSENGIVSYSYYGDWAGPADCCQSFEDARSAMIPGILMSTGYHYLNYKLLQKFAGILGDETEARENEKEALRVQKAFLEKWWHEETGTVDNGSQGCQAFALWLGILPEDKRSLAAQRLHEAVEKAGYRIQTGNLTTRYLMDMLSAYGYIEDAWKIITREEYPSWGFMLQNGATTVWERFEFKRGSGMNSHDHPMYGAVGYWFYSSLAGIKPGEDGWQSFTVEPHLPEKLLYAEAGVDTPFGMIYVKWQKQLGQTDVLVNVPFGTTAKVKLPWGETVTAGSGYHSYHMLTNTTEK